MEGEKGMEVRYYICKHCGNIVEKVKDKGVPVICCGEPMQELKAGVTDAAVEKHVPVYTIEGSHVHVVVGETKHPMLEEHFMCKIYNSIVSIIFFNESADSLSFNASSPLKLIGISDSIPSAPTIAGILNDTPSISYTP